MGEDVQWFGSTPVHQISSKCPRSRSSKLWRSIFHHWMTKDDWKSTVQVHTLILKQQFVAKWLTSWSFIKWPRALDILKGCYTTTGGTLQKLTKEWFENFSRDDEEIDIAYRRLRVGISPHRSRLYRSLDRICEIVSCTDWHARAARVQIGRYHFWNYVCRNSLKVPMQRRGGRTKFAFVAVVSSGFELM